MQSAGSRYFLSIHIYQELTSTLLSRSGDRQQEEGAAVQRTLEHLLLCRLRVKHGIKGEGAPPRLRAQHPRPGHLHATLVTCNSTATVSICCSIISVCQRKSHHTVNSLQISHSKAMVHLM